MDIPSRIHKIDMLELTRQLCSIVSKMIPDYLYRSALVRKNISREWTRFLLLGKYRIPWPGGYRSFSARDVFCYRM